MPDLLRGLLVWALTILILSGACYAVVSPHEPHPETVPRIQDGRPPHYEIEVKNEKGFREALLTDPVAFFTMILAIFTMGLAVTTIALWLEGRRLGAEQANLTREALWHADRSAKAAEGAIVIANLSSERQLRAYVGFESISVSGRDPKGNPTQLTVAVRNFGRTPAYGVRARMRWYSEREADQINSENIIPNHDGPSVLMPGAFNELVYENTTRIPMMVSAISARSNTWMRLTKIVGHVFVSGRD